MSLPATRSLDRFSEWVEKGKLVKLPAGVVPKVLSTMYDRLEREPCAKAMSYLLVSCMHTIQWKQERSRKDYRLFPVFFLHNQCLQFYCYE